MNFRAIWKAAQGHSHRPGSPGHTHGAVDPVLLTAQRGMWAVRWSFLGLLATALLQAAVVWRSGSVALLANTVHNFGDAATAIPLGIAFTLARLRPGRRFTYGYGRVEDLAGVIIVAIILSSAVFAAYQSIDRLIHPREVAYLWAVAAAATIGFLGNEGVAIFRLRVGKEIGSAALVADGYHARVDGLTSLAVLLGATGVWAGYPVADPIVGLLISIAIFHIVWQSGKAVFSRVLDSVDPQVGEEIKHSVNHVRGVLEVTQVRVRWLGHRLHAEVNIAVSPGLSIEAAHDVALEVQHQLLHHLTYLSTATVHVDPAVASGEEHHRIPEHAHDDLALHSH